jgi:uncharacterized protein (TIGR00290 family)
LSRNTLLSWSTGKDSAWALHCLRQDPEIECAGLFAVLNEKYDRVSMHSTRAALLESQAQAAELELRTIRLPDPCSNEQCDEIMGGFTAKVAAEGVECMAFGDLFLEEVRQYREKQMAGTGIEPIFPLWGRDTGVLAKEMLEVGVEAIISCVDLNQLPAEFAGCQWTQDLINELPEGADPCGENGEFHTVVCAGPMFERRIEVEVGEIVRRKGFAFADIVPVD